VTLLDRIKRRIAITEAACWEWLGAKTHNGYGQVWGGHDRGTARVHRVVFELTRGPIPEGLVVDHLCRNRACCNPEHLELCTQGDNARKAPDAPFWVRKRATHCERGHVFDEANTLTTTTGHRECRTCRALRAQNYKRKPMKKER
jgi:hypothetical protein